MARLVAILENGEHVS